MASRIVKLLKVTGVKGGVALLTGGLALDTACWPPSRSEMVNEKVNVQARSHPDSIYAGAIGAALWGGLPPRQARAARSRNRLNHSNARRKYHGPSDRRELHRLRCLQAGVSERSDPASATRST